MKNPRFAGLLPGGVGPVTETKEQRENRLKEIEHQWKEQMEGIVARSKEGGNIFPTFSELEKQYFTELMKISDYNIAQAIRISGVSRSNMYRRIKEYGIPRNGPYTAPLLTGLGPALAKKKEDSDG